MAEIILDKNGRNIDDITEELIKIEIGTKIVCSFIKIDEDNNLFISVNNKHKDEIIKHLVCAGLFKQEKIN